MLIILILSAVNKFGDSQSYYKTDPDTGESGIVAIENNLDVYDIDLTTLSYEEYNDIKDAITREKQIKGGSRKKKLELINSMNPEWNDLYESIK